MALDRFLMNAPKPTVGAVFDSLKTQAFLADGQPVHDQSYDVDKILLNADFSDSFFKSADQLFPSDYVDAHVSRFNPYSFELFLFELRSLGLLRSIVVEDCVVNGAEFIVRMCKQEGSASDLVEFSAEKRTELARKSVLFHAQDVSKKFKFLNTHISFA